MFSLITIDSYNRGNDGPYLTIVRSAKLLSVYLPAQSISERNQILGTGLGISVLRHNALLARSAQRLESGDHIEEFFVDAGLAQLVKGAVELLQ
jgi:hypothetical protein